MTLTLNRSSPAYKRMTKAGFTFKDPVAWQDKSYLYCDFTCVCGKEEHITATKVSEKAPNFKQVYLKDNSWDVAQVIEDHGAISVEHLRGDGYTEAQIRKIRRPYWRQDLIASLKKTRLYTRLLTFNKPKEKL